MANGKFWGVGMSWERALHGVREIHLIHAGVEAPPHIRTPGQMATASSAGFARVATNSFQVVLLRCSGIAHHQLDLLAQQVCVFLFFQLYWLHFESSAGNVGPSCMTPTVHIGPRFLNM